MSDRVACQPWQHSTSNGVSEASPLAVLQTFLCLQQEISFFHYLSTQLTPCSGLDRDVGT